MIEKSFGLGHITRNPDRGSGSGGADELPEGPGTLFFARHALNQSYTERVKMLEEGGFDMQKTSFTERISSVLLQEVQERREHLEGLLDAVEDESPIVDASERPAYKDMQTQLEREVKQLQALENVAHKIWTALGGPADLLQSLRTSPIAGSALEAIEEGHQLDRYERHQSMQSGVDHAATKAEAQSVLESISGEVQSIFVQEVIATLRSYMEALGRPTGTS
jgi:hypothetical protein